jgi:hypothetical protein
VAGAEEKIYPPYPDFWGRELPVPEGSMPGVRVYDNPDGDRLIRIVFDKTTKGVERPEWWTLAFFGGELKEIDVEEADRLFRAYRKTGFFRKSIADKVIFANGDVIQYGKREFGGNRCGSNYTYTIDKLNRAGKVLLSKMLFRTYHPPVRNEIWSSCDIAAGYEHYIAYADAILPDFVPLEDGTFLVHTYEDKFVVRFRPDLTSPYIDNKKLFLVDTAEIDRIVAQAYAGDGMGIQKANDAIRDYLTTLSKGE